MKLQDLNPDNLMELLEKFKEGDLRRTLVLDTLQDAERRFLITAEKVGRTDPDEFYKALAALLRGVQKDLFNLNPEDRVAHKLEIIGTAIDIAIVIQFLRLKGQGRTFRTLEETITTVFREEYARVNAVNEGQEDAGDN